MQAVLSTAYFAPIQYYCKQMEHSTIEVEQWENYAKQSYRNRCNIFGANGLLTLSVPVEKATRKKILTKDVRIAYDINWQKLHLKGIESAYKSSPFYEYYIDDILPILSKKWDFLMDMNQQINETICDILEIENKLTPTPDFRPLNSADFIDFRSGIHPKANKSKEDKHFLAQPYTQVFSNKLGFLPNLSILDLIFNLGNESTVYLESCIIQ